MAFGLYLLRSLNASGVAGLFLRNGSTSNFVPPGVTISKAAWPSQVIVIGLASLAKAADGASKAESRMKRMGPPRSGGILRHPRLQPNAWFFCDYQEAAAKTTMPPRTG